MTREEILSRVDHTLLKADATKNDIKELCIQAMENNTASICINPAFIEYAKEILNGEVAICTVIGFPLGAQTTATKVFEARDAILKGANEIDMVINISRAKDKDFEYIVNEIKEIKAAVGENILKVIVEACLLDETEKIALCKAVIDGGGDYIKTSTGFSVGGATLEDIKLFKEHTNSLCKIKAAGGIKTREDMEQLIALGADRLGTSSGIKILDNLKTSGY